MMHRSNILHVTDRLSARGGADWHLLGVIEAQRTEHRVHLAAGREDGSAAPPCPVTLVDGLQARGRRAVDLRRVLDDVQPDVIHLHNVMNPEVLEWGAGLGAILTIQDHRVFCPGRGKWTGDEICSTPLDHRSCRVCFTEPTYFERIYRLTRERLAAASQMMITVLSSYMKRELAAAGVPQDQVHVIPPFVHRLGQAAPDQGPPCVLFVGRLVEAKGALDAVEAWRRSGLDLPLVLAGTGSLRSALEERAASEPPGFEVTGWLSHRELSALYRRARVLLFPCRWQEPFGIVGLEALTMGVPVAAWDSGGVAEWCPPRWLVPWGDVEGLARTAAQIAGEAAAPPPGFERAALMNRLHTLYDRRRAPRRVPSP